MFPKKLTALTQARSTLHCDLDEISELCRIVRSGLKYPYQDITVTRRTVSHDSDMRSKAWTITIDDPNSVVPKGEGKQIIIEMSTRKYKKNRKRGLTARVNNIESAVSTVVDHWNYKR